VPRPIRFALVAAVVCAFGTLGASAQAAQVIVSPGPIQELHVGEDLSCQVSYGDASYEFYPPAVAPGDCGAFLAVDGLLYAPDFASHARTATSGLGTYEAFAPVEQTAVSGSGSASDPLAVETLVQAGTSGITLRQRVSYVSGEPSFRVDVTVTNETDAPRSIRIFYAGDCYASGSDIGYGFTRPEIGAVGCSQNPENVPPARTIQYSPLSPGSSFTEDGYFRVWEQIAELDGLDDLCLCGTSVDNGGGLSWDISLPARASATRSLTVSFTEATRSSPPADSDGDALPDAWETGTGNASDATNLAPLGADPHRKDLFVHADYMQGCQPRGGWERKAIDMFARHGVALHIDSGPRSVNADGRPWGDRSRAGEVPSVDTLPLQASWAAVDAMKDLRFVPANRRRAFHYALFARAYSALNGEGETQRKDGGLARGIPDADVLIANCGWRSRADAVVMVHELGHNLGLRHGGGDDLNDKPNHYSLMNYSWALSDVERGTLTDFSSSRRPGINESNLDEQDGLRTPAIWWCLNRDRSRIDQPAFYPQRIDSTGVRYDLDLDCDGTTGEAAGDVRYELPKRFPIPFTHGRFVSDINRDGRSTPLRGYDDWDHLAFGGAGVIGPLDLPARHDTPPLPELTSAEVREQSTAVAVGKKRARKLLIVRVSKRRVQRDRTVKLSIRVLVNGKPVRGARLRIKGARVLRPKRRLITNRRGVLVATVNPQARRQLVISSRRRGFERGAVVLAVRR